MIRGITVQLKMLSETGRDEFNVPVIEETWEDVGNVLVAPSSSEDLSNMTDLDGSETLYTMAIPKKDTHDWHKCRVRFFGCEWQAVGEPTKGIEENIPLLWNTKIVVRCIDRAK